MPPVEAVPVREGQVLAGKYRVERKLGAGGMGVVFQATHLQLEQRVAIKFLLPAAAENPEVVARFAREARAAAKIHGEHIVRVMDVAQLDDGTPYMVMEFLEGRDLSHEIERCKQLPVTQAVGWVLEACEAIADAHAAGIVHRDLKPANLFLSRRRDGGTTLKVLDFGISKTLPTGENGGADMSLTSTSAIMGSPLYMSPEQMRSTRSVDTRADIWALGVILYESLTGRVPFEAQQMTELCAKVLMEEPPAIASLRPEVPLQLAAAIEACLRKDPSARFQNVAELAAALAPFGPPSASVSAERARAMLEAAGVPIRPSADPASAPAAAQSGSTGVSWATTGRQRKRPALLAALAVVALIVIAVPVALLLRSRGQVSEPAASLVASVSAATESAPVSSQTALLVPASATASSAQAAAVPPPVRDVPASRTPPPKPSTAAPSAAPPTVPPATVAATAPPPVTATATATSKSNMNLK